MIKAIHKKIRASIMANREKLKAIALKSGTRKVCPVFHSKYNMSGKRNINIKYKNIKENKYKYKKRKKV